VPRQFDRCPAELPERHQDNSDDHGLDAVEDRLHLRQRTDAHVHRGQRANDHHSGQDEAATRDEETYPTGANEADVDRHLGRVRPGDQIRGADEIKKLLIGQPMSTLHDLALHQCNVRRRPTKRRGAQPQEEASEFADHGQSFDYLPAGVTRRVFVPSHD